jgi:hypothetical protein
MLLDTLGKKLVRFENTVEPVVGEQPVRSEFFDVQPGYARGLHQTDRAYVVDREFVSLRFRAALEEEPDGDTITIKGHPDITVRLQGTNGDLATVAIAVNAIHRTNEAPPGLATMRDLPIVTFFWPSLCGFKELRTGAGFSFRPSKSGKWGAA